MLLIKWVQVEITLTAYFEKSFLSLFCAGLHLSVFQWFVFMILFYNFHFSSCFFYSSFFSSKFSIHSLSFPFSLFYFILFLSSIIFHSSTFLFFSLNKCTLICIFFFFHNLLLSVFHVTSLSQYLVIYLHCISNVFFYIKKQSRTLKIILYIF